jgi:hypothetical protein
MTAFENYHQALKRRRTDLAADISAAETLLRDKARLHPGSKSTQLERAEETLRRGRPELAKIDEELGEYAAIEDRPEPKPDEVRKAALATAHDVYAAMIATSQRLDTPGKAIMADARNLLDQIRELRSCGYALGVILVGATAWSAERRKCEAQRRASKNKFDVGRVSRLTSSTPRQLKEIVNGRIRPSHVAKCSQDQKSAHRRSEQCFSGRGAWRSRGADEGRQ